MPSQWNKISGRSLPHQRQHEIHLLTDVSRCAFKARLKRRWRWSVQKWEILRMCFETLFPTEFSINTEPECADVPIGAVLHPRMVLIPTAMNEMNLYLVFFFIFLMSLFLFWRGIRASRADESLIDRSGAGAGGAAAAGARLCSEPRLRLTAAVANFYRTKQMAPAGSLAPPLLVITNRLLILERFGELSFRITVALILILVTFLLLTKK